MSEVSQRIARIMHRQCCQYPGGIQSIARILSQEDGRAESTIYNDLSPNMKQRPNGEMKEPQPKVSDLIRVQELVGNLDALNALNAHFGMIAVSMGAIHPDMPTVETEMLQDVPSVVELHKAIDEYLAGKCGQEKVLAALDFATQDLRQTVVRAFEDEPKSGHIFRQGQGWVSVRQARQ